MVKLLDFYNGMAATSINSGSTCLFWLDVWNNHILSLQLPQLFSFAKDQTITIQQVCQARNLYDLFNLPRLEKAFQQYQQLVLVLNDLHLQATLDQWTNIWGSSIFTLKKVYDHLIGSPQVHSVFRWL